MAFNILLRGIGPKFNVLLHFPYRKKFMAKSVVQRTLVDRSETMRKYVGRSIR